MDLERLKLLRAMAKRGKYALLHDFLIQRFLLNPTQKEWKTTFQEIERILGFRLPNSARIHRPWVTEPGLWLQYDFGDGPVIEGRPTVLFCAWLAWCRFRIVIPLRDRTIPSVFAALDTSFRMLGGAPTYLLTDNEKSVTVEHVAGLPVRNVQAVAFGRHYGVTIHTCVPYDPASKGLASYCASLG